LFGKREENGEVGPSWEQLTEEHSFDELARGLASGAISRRRALKLVGTAILGTALVPLSPGVAEAAPRCPHSGAAGCNVVCKGSLSGAHKRCRCVQTTEGERVCVFPECGSPNLTCQTSLQCPPGQVCSTTAGECCQAQGPVCVRRCNNEQSPSRTTRSASDRTWTKA
jgi:hypothetical protein